MNVFDHLCVHVIVCYIHIVTICNSSLFDHLGEDYL